jgi:NAD(P)-dependent dehydrogenase (short-subunit alcohol dehydrogenase family)
MQIDLSGKTALVTGSTLGIGFAIAKGLHEAGASVVLNSRSQERVDAAVMRLGSDRHRVRGVAADVGTAEGCDALVVQVPTVDVLVNNAGAFGPQPFLDGTDDKWQKLFDMNVMSGVRLSRHYLPQMLERNWGRFIFTSSVDALQVPANMVDYAATKLAQLAISRGIAQSARGTRVTSNALIVGPTHSEGAEGFMGFGSGGYTGCAVIPPGPPIASTLEEAMEILMASESYSGTLIGRMADCEEVANMAVYLASDQASVTTGATLRVDGGTIRSSV